MMLFVSITPPMAPRQFIGAATPASWDKMQPELQVLARQPVATLTRIIVQKTSAKTDIEANVMQMGGQVTADLHIIKGFAATLPTSKLSQLAQLPGVRWMSLDAPVVQSACSNCIPSNNLQNKFVRAIGADKVWAQQGLQGQGIGVAVIDSGINSQQDLYTSTGYNRIVASVRFNNGYNQSQYDGYGHGSHVAGVIGGNGSSSQQNYVGVAPQVNIVNVKVGDDLNQGQGTASTVVQGLQWVLDNKSTYNIRVVNISLNNALAESYQTNPICAAAEILWFNKIVVVVSAGNQGSGAIYPPANDPFVITVGAVDGKGSDSISDDVMATFSAYGTTSDGFAKPDLVAPGKDIVGLMGNSGMGMSAAHPANIVTYNGANYFRMSGTSAAAPVVAGAAALLVQSNPNLTPDQIKYRLMSTANKSWAGYAANKAGAGYLDIYAAVSGGSTQSANTNIKISKLLTSGSQPVGGLVNGTVNWSSVNWSSVNWSSVNWSSVNWSSVNWSSDYWGP